MASTGRAKERNIRQGAVSVPPLLGVGLGLVFFSALTGAAITTDAQHGLQKLALLSIGLLAGLGASSVPSHVRWRAKDVPLLRIVVAIVPAIIAIHFLLTADWSQPLGKVAWLASARTWLASHVSNLGWPRPHPNAVGGVLAMLLPLQFRALPSAWHLRDLGVPGRAVPVLNGLLIALTLGALLLTGLRGAWLALVFALGAWGWWLVCDRLLHARGRVVTFGAWAGPVCAVAVACAKSGAAAGWLASRPDRLLVWMNSWALAWDYFYTGLGLGNFTMPYSSYALLVHVPHTTHAHNLFLDIWLEQGALGLISFAGLVLTAFLARRGQPPAQPRGCGLRKRADWRAPALVALTVMVVHGLVDDSYCGYGGAGIVLMFVPIGLAWRRDLHPRARILCGWQPTVGLVGSGIAVLLILTLLMPSTRALWHANIGTLLQSRSELGVYRWPEWPLQDALRRSATVDITPAIKHYRDSLRADPANVVANRRLGQIELSIGQYAAARTHLQAAFAHSADNQATRQMYGESLALTGHPEAAAAIWQAIGFGEGQLDLRQWWYAHYAPRRNAEWFNEAVQRVRPGTQ